jgi:phosphoribosylformimino-5-aminoimidazole carboxamide ribotide isomerase
VVAVTVLPAIDLLGGKVVRLREGRREEATVYSDDPGATARELVAGGAARLHVVDLDGAFAGRRVNEAAVRAILAAGARVQAGGGVRTLAAVEELLAAGADRVVLGTAMVASRGDVAEACARFPGRIVVAVDARGGKVAVSGWAEETELDPFDLAAEAAELGAAAILFTAIARDGTGVGPDVEATARLARTLHPVEVIASGGVGSLADLRALALAGVPAAVVGRAIYEKKFTVREAIAAAGAQ